MARYLGVYTDRFVGTATYTLTKNETKSVKNSSTNIFKSSFDLTSSAYINVNGSLLLEVSALGYDLHFHKQTDDATFNATLMGLNLNLFGAFGLSTSNTHALGRVVTSHGYLLWSNVAVFKVLWSKVTQTSGGRLKRNTKDEVEFAAVRYLRTKQAIEMSGRANTS
ncbi:hypothetical protein [Advenella mimigardefordensis]|uniref:Uncharacterized protein n=1 Tax=Advenella mimigardefordensis (strain DSM 17166 / LMG 22922 / DPN7) TaxID=1247726 RepID=W0PKB7_ADVMD|nr:hypothetical protein [Advenella mimigardefordensis]AHG65438.1 hypothetical protein MIM_c33770 [Advenella mimigardefordensis DPN7]